MCRDRAQRAGPRLTRLGRDDHDKLEDMRPQTLVLNLGRFEASGAVQRTDIAIEDGFVEFCARAKLHVIPHELLGNVGDVLEPDGDFSDLVLRRIRAPLAARLSGASAVSARASFNGSSNRVPEFSMVRTSRWGS